MTMEWKCQEESIPEISIGEKAMWVQIKYEKKHVEDEIKIFFGKREVERLEQEKTGKKKEWSDEQHDVGERC